VTALDFPYRIEPGGRTATTEEADHIRDLVEQLLFTMPGERVMRPDFGSGLMQLVFQPNSDELATAVQLLVQGSLQQWLGELITVEAVEVTADESTIEVVIRYVVRLTQERRTETFNRRIA
jgi:Bacteriophage baseplate protein W